MYRWFIPCWSGDFRFQADSKDPLRCVLTVENPTVADLEKLTPFLAEASARGWYEELAGIQPVGKTILPIKASMLEAGPILAELALPADRDKWTAIRRGDDAVTLEDGVGASLRARLERGAIEVKGDVGQLVDVVAAVTMAAPVLGCPPPQPAPTRASQVLAAFSTNRQITSFQNNRFLIAIGNASGKAYRIFHRDEARRRGMGHTIVVDVERGREVCAWDDTVPAEEEVLSLKLAVEHRELWLIQVASGFSPSLDVSA